VRIFKSPLFVVVVRVHLRAQGIPDELPRGAYIEIQILWFADLLSSCWARRRGNARCDNQ
jgi:hypothetical protein